MPAFVNAANASSGAGVTSLALAATSLTGGNDIVIAVSIKDTTVSVSSITDTAGNTYTLKSSVNNSTDIRCEEWGAHNVTGNGSNIVTVNFSGSTICAIASAQYSSVNAFGNTGTNTGTNQHPYSSLLTQNANDFAVVAIAWAASSTDTVAASTGNLRTSKVDAGGGTTAAVAICDFTTPGIATLMASGKLSVSRPWAGVAVNLRTATTAATNKSYEGRLPIMAVVTLAAGTTNLYVRNVRMPLAGISTGTAPSPDNGQGFPPRNLAG